MRVDCRRVEHGSPEYGAEIELRRRVLRAPLGLDFTPEQLQAEAGDVHLCAYVDGALAGCLVLTPCSREAVQMRQVAVEPSLQRLGIGRALVEESEHVARSLGFRSMVLHARDTAVPFYLRLGYAPRGAPFEEVTIPHLEMVKGLA